MPFYPSPCSLLELLTWSLLSGLVIPSYPRAFYGETAQGFGYPSSHTEVVPSDAQAASASTHESGVFPQREESVVVQPRRGFPGRQVPSAAGGAADFGHRLTNHGGAQLESGKHIGTEKSPEFEAGIRGTFSPPSPPLVDLTPEDHQWLREIMRSPSPPKRPSLDSSIHGQHDRHSSAEQTNIVSSGKSKHIFTQGMLANSNIVDHRMNTEISLQLDRNKGAYYEDDRQARSERIRKGNPHLPDVPVAISSRVDFDPLPRFTPNYFEQPRGLRLNGYREAPRLPGQEQSQFEPHHGDRSYFINSQPTSTHQQLVPNPQSMRPNPPDISPSPSVPAGTPREHITQLLSDAINLVKNKALPRFIEQVWEELWRFAHRIGGFRPSGEIHEFEGIAAIHMTWPTVEVSSLASSVVCVQTILQHRHLTDTPKVMVTLEPLIKWMLLKQAAFLFTTGKSKQSLQVAHDNLMMWFVKGVFTPDGSLPVFGKVPALISSYDRSAFGALQQFLIDYLSTSTNANEAHQAASNVIRLWLQDCSSKLENFQFGDDALWTAMTHAIESSLSTFEFWHFMNDGIGAAGTKKVTESKDVPPSLLMKEVRNLDNFQPKHIFINSIFGSPPSSVVQKRIVNFTQLIREIPNVIDQTDYIKIVKHMVLKIFSLSKAERGNKGCLVKTSLEVPVGLAKSFRFSVNKMYHTRLLRTGKSDRLEPVPSREVVCRLVKLLGLIQGYHTVLLHVSERKNHRKIDNSQIHMLSWLCNEFFSHQTGFPIFAQRKSLEDSLEPGQFNMAQRILIHYLVEPPKQSQAESDQVFIALLKYWYKTFFPAVWEVNFTNDFNYWLLMSHAMSNFQVTQRLVLTNIFTPEEWKAAIRI